MGIFIDIQKAFESLEIYRCTKMTFYGMKGLKCAYYVVPQGSLLLPVVLFHSINEIFKCFDGVRFVLYADDTNQVVESDTINGLYMPINRIDFLIIVSPLIRTKH